MVFLGTLTPACPRCGRTRLYRVDLQRSERTGESACARCVLALDYPAIAAQIADMVARITRERYVREGW